MDIAEIQRILKDGAAIREASYNKEEQRYTKHSTDACVEASPTNPEIGWLIGLALDGWWNDALEWADKPHV